MYFLSPDDPQVPNLEDQLVSTNIKKLRESLVADEKEIPQLLIDHAVELFDDNLRDILNENKRELKTTKDVQDLIDDWSAFTVGTLVNIYEGKVTFWDEAILDSDCNLVVNFLNLLVF